MLLLQYGWNNSNSCQTASNLAHTLLYKYSIISRLEIILHVVKVNCFSLWKKVILCYICSFVLFCFCFCFLILFFVLDLLLFFFFNYCNIFSFFFFRVLTKGFNQHSKTTMRTQVLRWYNILKQMGKYSL